MEIERILIYAISLYFMFQHYKVLVAVLKKGKVSAQNKLDGFSSLASFMTLSLVAGQWNNITKGNQLQKDSDGLTYLIIGVALIAITSARLYIEVLEERKENGDD